MAENYCNVFRPTYDQRISNNSSIKNLYALVAEVGPPVARRPSPGNISKREQDEDTITEEHY